MRRLSCMVIIVASFTFPAWPQSTDCAKLEGEAQKTKCLEESFAAAESRMNAVFSRVIAKYTEPDADRPREPERFRKLAEKQAAATVTALRVSQKQWLLFRKTACEALERSYEGGTAAAQAVPTCLKELTEQRTSWLKESFLPE